MSNIVIFTGIGSTLLGVRKLMGDKTKKAEKDV